VGWGEARPAFSSALLGTRMGGDKDDRVPVQPQWTPVQVARPLPDGAVLLLALLLQPEDPLFEPRDDLRAEATASAFVRGAQAAALPPRGPAERPQGPSLFMCATFLPDATCLVAKAVTWGSTVLCTRVTLSTGAGWERRRGRRTVTPVSPMAAVLLDTLGLGERAQCRPPVSHHGSHRDLHLTCPTSPSAHLARPPGP
jgi:hypothetical protein